MPLAATVPLCIAPAGTINLVAREIGYARDPEKLAAQVSAAWRKGAGSWLAAPLYTLGEMPVVACLSIGVDALAVAIGTSMLEGGAVSLVTVTAIFLSNIPEGLSSAAGMRKAGRSPKYVFGLWGGLMVLLGLASIAGYAIFGQFSPEVVAGTTAVAAGAILAMLVDTMIPEAFELAHDFAGLITVVGFLLAFGLSKWGG